MNKINNKEIWYKVNGNSNNYEISTNGEVRNVKTKKKLICTPDNDGYMKINLHKEGGRCYLVHRLLYFSVHNYVDDKENYDIHHINRNPSDNRLQNLIAVHKSVHIRKHINSREALKSIDDMFGEFKQYRSILDDSIFEISDAINALDVPLLYKYNIEKTLESIEHIFKDIIGTVSKLKNDIAS